MRSPEAITLSPYVRRCAAYREGRDCFRMSVPTRDCPYRHGPRRVAWMVGWYDARTALVLGKIFRRYEISFP